MSNRGPAISFRLRWGHLLTLAAVGGVFGLLVLVALLYWPHQPRHYQLDEAKGFGWFDPHLVMAVVAVERERDDSGTGDSISRDNVFRVTVEVHNTAAGPDFVVDPSALTFSVHDTGGGLFPPAPTPEYPDERLTEQLHNSGSYRRTLRFEVPSGAHQPELWVVAETGLERWLPSISRSLITHKLVFPLEQNAAP